MKLLIETCKCCLRLYDPTKQPKCGMSLKSTYGLIKIKLSSIVNFISTFELQRR